MDPRLIPGMLVNEPEEVDSWDSFKDGAYSAMAFSWPGSVSYLLLDCLGIPSSDSAEI